MRKVKSQIIHISTDMFPPGLVLLMAGKDESLYEELLLKLIKVNKEELEDLKEAYREGEDADGFVSMQTKGGKWQMIVFTDEKDWKNTLVHESLHAVEQLCNYRDIPICKETEELRAMMLGHIYGEIQSAIKI